MWNKFADIWPPENTVILLTDDGDWGIQTASWNTEKEGRLWEFLYVSEIYPRKQPPARYFIYIPKDEAPSRYWMHIPRIEK